jgi:Peptidase_C39 like family
MIKTVFNRYILFVITAVVIVSFTSVSSVFAVDRRFNESNGIYFSEKGATRQGVAAGSFVYYSQTNPLWKNEKYGTSTIELSGCGPTSLAMIVATLVDKNVTPKQVADFGTANGSFIPGTGTSHYKLLEPASKKWGFKYEDISSSSIDLAIDVVKNGGLVYMGGAGPAPFTAGGHIIVLRGITDDGKLIIGDPWRGEADVYEKSTIEAYRGSTFGIYKL